MGDPAILQPQNAVIPLVTGVNLKAEQKAVEPPELLALDNASFFAPGELGKDNGYQSLTQQFVGGGAITGTPRRIIGLGGRQSYFVGGAQYERVESADGYRQLDSTGSHFLSQSVETTNLNAGNIAAAAVASTGFVYCDYAVNAGYELVAMQDNSPVLVYVIRERATKSILYTGGVAISNTPCRVLATGTYLVIVYVNGVNVRADIWNTASPGTAPTTSTFFTNAGATHMDAIPTPGAATFTLVYQNSTPRLVIAICNPATGTVASSNITVVATVNRCLCVCADAASNFLVLWGNSATGLMAQGYTSALATRSNSVADAAATGINATAVTACDTGSGATACVVYFEGSSDNSIKRLLCNFSGSGTTLGPSGILYGFHGFAHKAIAIDGVVFFGVGRVDGFGASALGSLCCTMRQKLSSLAVLDPLIWYVTQLAEVGPSAAFSNATPGLSLDGTEYRFSIAERRNLGASSSGGRQYALSQAICSFRLADGSALPVGLSTAIAGGVALDQLGLRDIALPYAAEIFSLADSASAGSLVALQTYEYVAVFEMLDSYGQVAYSIPSAPKQRTLAAGKTAVDITLAPPLARLVASGLLNLKTTVYRTIAGAAGVHYKLTVSSTLTRLGSFQIVLTDTEADATILPRQALYTDSGLLEAYPPPHGRCWCLHQNRIFVIDEHTQELRYTREIVSGEGPAWHPNLAIELSSDNLTGIALCSSSNGLWIFGTDRTTGQGAISLLTGFGPNDLGQGSSYSLQRLEGAHVTAAHHRAVLATPAGILFYDSNQGLHLLDGQAVQFVGARAQAYFTAAPIDMQLLIDRKEVRCVNADGSIVVWYYDVNAWGRRTTGGVIGSTVVDACLWNNRHTILVADGSVCRRRATGNRDASTTFVPMTFTTGWIKLAQFEGLVRLWRITLIGRKVSPAGVTIVLTFDYENAGFQAFTFTEGQILALTNSAGIVEIELGPNRQICQAFQIQVTDTAPAGTGDSGSGIAWSAMRLDYGVYQRRARRLPAQRRAS